MAYSNSILINYTSSTKYVYDHETAPAVELQQRHQHGLMIHFRNHINCGQKINMTTDFSKRKKNVNPANASIIGFSYSPYQGVVSGLFNE